MHNSTIIPKRRKLSCGCFDFAFSNNMCKHHSTILSTQKRISSYEQEIDKESIQNVMDDLDTVVSLIVRIRDSDIHGIATCCTCGFKGRYQDMDAGHFIPRAHLSCRWLLTNIFAQCRRCNRMEYGNEKAMATYIDNLRKGTVEWLKEQSREVSKPTLHELKILLAEMRAKLKTVKQKLIQ